VATLPDSIEMGQSAKRGLTGRNALCLAIAATCTAPAAAQSSGRVRVTIAGHAPDGSLVHLYRIVNDRGLVLTLLDYGATMASIEAPDRRGRRADILVHPGTPAEMIAGSKRNGRTVGRYAGRLRGGFTLDGQAFPLKTGPSGVTLHGGDPGLDRALWHGTPFSSATEDGVVFSLASPDGAQGFPGRLRLRARYAVGRATNRITIRYEATTDRATVINLTNHAYFNLAGSGTIDCQWLSVAAARYVATDSRKLPTGALLQTAGTPLDFRAAARLAARIGSTDPLIASNGGLDHMLLLDRGGGARLFDPGSGRTLDLTTDQPGLQVYSGNGFDGSEQGSDGRPIVAHAGLALEAGRLPDSPNIPAFPSALLRPGQVYRAVTTLRLGIASGGSIPAGEAHAAPECRSAG